MRARVAPPEANVPPARAPGAPVLTIYACALHPAAALRERLGAFRAPALERLVARGRTDADVGADYYGGLFALFGVGTGPSPPVAAVTRVLDFPATSGGVWMRADPVHLHPDLNRLRLFGADHFTLGPEDARALVTELNEALAPEGIELHCGTAPKRWYLRLDSAPDLITTPPEAVYGRHLDPFLPTGADAAAWRRLANTAQMVLHASAANAAREGRGEPPVNALWFWGAGAAPAPGRVFDRVWTDCEVAAGLAALAGSEVEPLPRDESWAVERAGLVVARGLREADLCADETAWRRALEMLEEAVAAPALAALRRGRLGAVTLVSDRARHVLTRGRAWRPWPPRRAL